MFAFTVSQLIKRLFLPLHLVVVVVVHLVKLCAVLFPAVSLAFALSLNAFKECRGIVRNDVLHAHGSRSNAFVVTSVIKLLTI